jgi:hypothetical protein
MEQVEQVESGSAVVDEGGTVDSPGRCTGGSGRWSRSHTSMYRKVKG